MRLIDADDANVDDIFCYYENNCCVEDVEEWLKDQPTIDAVPVVHGRWKSGGIINECQVCGEIYSLNGGNAHKPWNYCPNCGAKMDGETD